MLATIYKTSGTPSVLFSHDVRVNSYLTPLYITVVQHLHKLQDAQLLQGDRATECVIVFAKSRRLELGEIFYGHYIGLSSTTAI